MQLPTAREINPIPEDLDGKYAEVHFLGKTPDDAVAMFEEAFEYYQEDLMNMGTSAFCFYLPAAIEYAESADARHDALVAGMMLSLMQHRWEFDAAEILSMRDSMCRYCADALLRVPEMDVDPEIDGDLAGRFSVFLELLKEGPPD